MSVILAVVAVLCASPALLATTYCEDIDGNYIMVGEARYMVLSGASDDEVYANSYWDLDTSNELALDAYIGGARSSGPAATNLNFYAYGYMKDVTGSDCSDTTFTLTLERSSSSSAGCPTTPETTNNTLVVTGCDAGVGQVWAGKLFGRGGLSYSRYWNAIVEADSAEVTLTSDSGCFHVKDQTDCTLVDY